jgi:hypothetical protein
MTLTELTANARKRAAKLKRAVYAGRYFKKHDRMGSHEHEQLVLEAANVAERLARIADALNADGGAR